jgi:hypothetical protein
LAYIPFVVVKAMGGERLNKKAGMGGGQGNSDKAQHLEQQASIGSTVAAGSQGSEFRGPLEYVLMVGI